jgi:hypothetical protein
MVFSMPLVIVVHAQRQESEWSCMSIVVSILPFSTVFR